ncbi:hypothetical protein AB0M57_24155 [Streptomyces sp. NPDC051597]|uniref:hypothetical protein n=1 Tax=Streptomyces sp. NPDC051597 TaxID=3155049 RepID=UPI003422D7E9
MTTRTTTSEPRLTTALGADGVLRAAVVIERDHTPAEGEELGRRIIQRAQERERQAAPEQRPAAASVRRARPHGVRR